MEAIHSKPLPNPNDILAAYELNEEEEKDRIKLLEKFAEPGYKNSCTLILVKNEKDNRALKFNLEK